MRIGDTAKVFQLAQALLFSLLYGAEFLTRVDVLERCEVAWWNGIRKFYGLPNGVSNVTLALLFPKFSLKYKVLLGKVSLGLRGMRKLDTLLPEALIFDRGALFDRHRVGFFQEVRDWGLHLGISDLFLATDRSMAVEQLETWRETKLDSEWDTFSRMSSTATAASILGNRVAFHKATREASRFSRLGLRVFLLAITGSLAQSYLKSRSCSSCGVQFSFAHFLTCPLLGEDMTPSLVRSCEEEDWKHFSLLVLTRFQTFLHFYREGRCDADEVELFSALGAADSES
jgi:hypothetical protein